jgi:hypothetical protein
MNNEQLQKEIIAELKLENLTQEEREHIVTTLGENIIQQAILDLYDMLPADAQAEFKNKAETSTLEELVELFSPHVGDVDEVIKQSSTKIISEFKTLVSGS